LSANLEDKIEEVVMVNSLSKELKLFASLKVRG